MKKIHLLSANSKNPYGMEFFVSKAFKELGYEVIETDYRVLYKEEVSTRIKCITDAEFLLCIKGERIIPEDIFACRIPTILWLQDSVQANQEANFVIQTKSSLFDLVYSFNETELPFYKQFNKNSYLLLLGADKEIHKKVDIEKTINVGFCGSLNNNRINMINILLDHGIPIQYNYTHQGYPEIVSKTKINLNCGITDSGYQMRIFEILSMEGFLLTNKIKDGSIFKDKEHLVYYENFDNLIELIYYYIERPEEMKRISENGRKEVLKNHLYTNRVQKIVEDVWKMQN